MITHEEKEYYRAQEARFTTLESIEKASWESMLSGALSSKSDFNQPVIGTIAKSVSSLRTVVLRKVWTDDKKLAFYTDLRSGKINDLTLNDNISWLFYSPRHRLQIRLGGKAEILTDTPLVRESWNKTLESSAKTYMTTLAPSTIVAQATSGLSPEYELREPTRAESAEAVSNFAVVVTEVEWMEWLWLNKKGHRRAQFVYNEDLTFKGDWLVP
jgi:pyridoxamine 5'-phosphate oxidase